LYFNIVSRLGFDHLIIPGAKTQQPSLGTYIISASTDQQYAAEIKDLGHGVFTYTLIEGLQGKRGEKKVTVEGLIHYVKNRLPELTEKH